MAPKGWRQGDTVDTELRRNPDRFEFFQAVRLLELAGYRKVLREGERDRFPVGYDRPPEKEFVRFRVIPSLRFAVTAVRRILWPGDRGKSPEAPDSPDLQVTFMGLTGPAGVLPNHYTELLIKRGRDRDFALRHFFDLFHHRTISLFYRAWEKYRFPFTWERSRLDPSVEDRFTSALYALVGLGQVDLRHRMEVADEAVAHYAGLFAHSPRSAIGLERMLSDYLGLPVEVQQYQGRWLMLDKSDQSALPTALEPQGRFTELGINTVIGERVWDVQGKFRIRVGPVSYRDFNSLSPTEAGLRRLAQITRLYVGPEFDFDVQVVLKGEEVPRCTLQLGGEFQPRLGWNTWGGVFPEHLNSDDAIYEIREI